MPKIIGFSLCLLFSATALAGSLVDGEWSSTRCGIRPPVANLDLKNVDAFNKSVEAVDGYRKQINVYLDCLVAEGNVDIQQISRKITEAQLAAKAADDKISADAKTAAGKFANP